MTDEFTHLGPIGLKWAALDAQERIRYLLDLLDERRRRPKGSFKPNVLIWGESGQGTTSKPAHDEGIPIDLPYSDTKARDD